MLGLVVRLALVALMVAKTWKDKSLTKGGVFAAGITGLIHSIGADGALDLCLLLGFFITGTRFTKFKADYKQTLVAQLVIPKIVETNEINEISEISSSSAAPPSQDGLRDHTQVLCNSIIASILILAGLTLPLSERSKSVLRFGVISHYAAVTADTWSSELGILSKKPPILITTLKPCPRGVNGGVSHFGLGCAVLAGTYIGALSLLFNPFPISAYNSTGTSAYKKLEFLVAVSVLGLFGSLVDSLLGALMQQSVVDEHGLIVESSSRFIAQPTQKVYSGFDCLSNNQVNIAMAGITTVVGMAMYRLL